MDYETDIYDPLILSYNIFGYPVEEYTYDAYEYHISLPYTTETVLARQVVEDLSPTQVEEFIEQADNSDYNILAEYDDPTTYYNCHSYAWYSQDFDDNDLWIDNPLRFYDDGRYCCSETPQVGDIICYFTQLGTDPNPYTDTNIHSGIVTEVYSSTSSGLADNVEIKSKWGAGGLYLHAGDDCPYTNADYVRYFRTDHTISYTNIGASGHREICTECDYVGEWVDHDDTMSWENVGSTGHKGICDECGYETEVISHNDTVSFESVGAGGHRLECSLCGYTSSTQSHNYSTTLVSVNAEGHGYRCSRCEYAESTAHDVASLSIIDCDEQGHAYKCDECSIRASSMIPHFYGSAYINQGVLQGHARECSICAHEETPQPHVWTQMLNGKYKCNACYVVTDNIGSVMGEPPVELLGKLNELFGDGDGAIAFDGDTVLCRVDGEYYLVKGTTVENAVAFVTQELLTE